MLAKLIDQLGYVDSPNFLRGEELGRAGNFSHIFRRAQERMSLHGVYVLRQPRTNGEPKSLVPVVYVCEGDNDAKAQEIRRLAWNQNAAPFLIVTTPSRVRLFSTFNYDRRSRPSSNVLDRPIAFEEIAHALSAFTSRSIDDGTIWRECGRFVTPKKRVDWSLLDALDKLDEALIEDGLEWSTSHALIGKYVYLWYLRQREILSDDRFGGWNIDPEEVFGRNARRTAVRSLLEKLELWLNGSVFPLNWTGNNAPRQEHVRKVAAVFRGDNLNGQLHLPFDAYDFSVIPVETLSAIYEQFLHAHEPKREQPRGKELGAYYTPVPLVNFMLDELEDRRPLKEGMTCFDASCGSGAFLVQCFRRLIENRVRQDGQAVRRPAELRGLLTKHIFGLDRDGDACRVTELSLILTLLDYVQPPDLLPVHNFKLPDLHNSNIFEADFFDPDSTWTRSRSPERRRYDWVVGNPPWVELKPLDGVAQEGADDKDGHARKWISDNKLEKPTSGDQLAEAFLWKVVETLKPNGLAGMLVPAMTLFKSESANMRQHFFRELDVPCVANFANMAYVLFAGRAETPAAAIFYSVRTPEAESGARPAILCYSPLIASQESNRPEERAKKDTWSIVVNASDVREVPLEDAASGDNLVWKLAMWGSRLDHRLLHSIAREFDGLQEIVNRLGMRMNEGFQLREHRPSGGSNAAVDQSLAFKKELVGKYELDSSKLRRCGRIYSFPDDSLVKIAPARAFLRKRGGEKGLAVSAPPHIIVDSARRFAVYCDEFVAVPSRQVGIGGSPEQTDLLKALSLFLMSDFARYHQFLTSPQFGVYKSIADLDNLKELPFPLEGIQRSGPKRWSRLHAELVASAARTERDEPAPLYKGLGPPDRVAQLEAELNGMVNDALGLTEPQRWLVADLVHVRAMLTKGKVDPVATGSASPKEMRAYAHVLKQELDSFIEVATDDRHAVYVCHERGSAMIMVHRGPDLPLHNSVWVLPAASSHARALRNIRQKLLQKHGQWLYFERALTCYANGSTYLFKPMQRLHWVRSQALVDAGEIIADRAGGGGS